jgi:DNA-binding response OmpR family regulator
VLAQANILLIEDNAPLREVTAEMLREAGHRVFAVDCVESLEDAAFDAAVDVLVVDLGLPGEDGLSYVNRFRTVHPRSGVVIVTARTGVDARVSGYRNGADVYVTKPFFPQELDAIIRGLLRKQRQLGAGTGDDDGLVLDTARREVRGIEDVQPLDPASAALLAALARAPGRTLDTGQIIEVLGKDPDTYSKSTLEVRITRLRQKLQAAGARGETIRSVRALGYTLCVPLTIV